MSAVSVENLSFDFGGAPILKEINLQVKPGSRCLLVGANGAGKSTLLKIVSGKHLVKAKVEALGKRTFDQGSAGITYLGDQWANNPIVKRDVPVSRLLKSLGAERFPERCSQLLDILCVNPNWHMHQCSDGQRRRVQIVLGLLEPWSLLLLDEVTADLDVLVRADLLNFLKTECETRNATIMYATHIFDGLGNWPTHLVHISDGQILRLQDFSEPFPELEHALGNRDSFNSPLLAVVEQWLRGCTNERDKQFDQEGKEVTRWDVLSQNMKDYGDKYYNYWR
jgi:CCR4-NOT complex subunit CAF16